MASSLSTLGIIHTAISVVALVFAAVSLVRDARIIPHSKTGIYYTITNVLACVTSFGLSKEGGFNPGHAIAIMILVLLAVSYAMGHAWTDRPVALYIQTFLMTTTVFLSLVPAINETLTHLPPSHPIAESKASPAVQAGLKLLVVVYLAGLLLQFFKIRGWVKKHSQKISF
ncbi:MAG TPA: hypothetical protein VJ720_10945 [Chitinophaga sp.]|nr:hypothetical protein [Chitinophaga sp.]